MIPAAAGPGPLTRAVTGGALWMGGSLGVQIGIGLVAQVILAAILTAHDFGLFALVIAVSYALSSIGNFGIKTLMASRTVAEIAAMRRPALRVGLVAAVVSGLLLVAISPLVASLLGEPDLRWLLSVTAITFPLKPFVAVSSATLQADLRFRAVAGSLLAGSLAGYTAAIVLAVLGAGPLSLVINLQVNIVVTALVCWFALRAKSQLESEPGMGTRELLTLSWWPLAGEVAMDANGRLDFLMLGLFVPTEIVGVYYFAFQLVVRLNELLSGVARNVLFPALAQIPDRPDRQAAGVVRAGAALAIGGGAVAALLIATMAPIEEILWGGRWALAVPAVMLLATAAPAQAVQSAVEQLLKARARFRRWTAIITVRAVGSAIVALLAGMILGDRATATMIATVIVGFLIVEALGEVLWIGRGLGVPMGTYLQGAVPPWGLFVGLGWAIAGLLAVWNPNPWIGALAGGGCVGLASGGVGLVLVRSRRTGDEAEVGVGDSPA